MDLLFPRTAKVTSSETNATEIASGSISKQYSVLGTENGTAKPHENWEQLREISDIFKSMGRNGHRNSTSLLRTKKAEVEEQVDFLVAAVRNFPEMMNDSNADETTLSEANTMIEDLKQLALLLDKSDSADKHLTEIGELLKKLDSHRVKCNLIFELGAQMKDTVGNVMDDNEGSRKASDSSVATNKPHNQENERGNGKGKKNTNKQRKGKGRGKK